MVSILEFCGIFVKYSKLNEINVQWCYFVLIPDRKYEILLRHSFIKDYLFEQLGKIMFDVNVMFKNFQVLYAVYRWFQTFYGVINFCQILRTIQCQ